MEIYLKYDKKFTLFLRPFEQIMEYNKRAAVRDMVVVVRCVANMVHMQVHQHLLRLPPRRR